MTISQDPSALLVAVVGATGKQGGSVINGLEESDKPYRIRGFTRDATKPAAQALAKRGVEVLAVNLVVENKEEVYRAFIGADVAFLVTNFWEHCSMEKEINEGKLLIDAAKSAGVSRIVWSGLPSLNKLSSGKYSHAYHYDGKAVVTEYARQSGVPFVDLQTGFYGTNFLTLPILLAKQEEGLFAIPVPAKPTTLIPFIDIERDYGLWVRHVLELPAFPKGSTIVAYGENISIQDLAKQLSKATGKEVVVKEISIEQFRQNVQASGIPPAVVLTMSDAFESLGQFGWPTALATIPGLPRRPRTWAEFAEDTDWSKALL